MPLSSPTHTHTHTHTPFLLSCHLDFTGLWDPCTVLTGWCFQVMGVHLGCYLTVSRLPCRPTLTLSSSVDMCSGYVFRLCVQAMCSGYVLRLGSHRDVTNISVCDHCSAIRPGPAVVQFSRSWTWSPLCQPAVSAAEEVQKAVPGSDNGPV